jgi:hypothetical protein
MNSQDIRNLQEAYQEVYQLDEKEDSPYEKASDAALDARYGYGRASGDKRSFGRAANRSSAAAALRALRRGERSGSGTSTEAGSDAVHQGWARTAKTSADQTPEKKKRRAGLANTPYSKLPEDEKEKDRVSFNAVRAVYNRNKTQKEQVDLYDIILSHLLDEGYADTQQAAEAIMVNMSEDWREDIVEAAAEMTPQKRDFMQRQKAKLIDSGKIEQAKKVNAATYYTDVDASRKKETNNRRRGGNKPNPATPDTGKRKYRSGGFSKKPEETERDYLDRRWDVAQYLRSKE